MNENQKKFNIYVFLSTFARNLIEVFIPVILYKFGYNLKEVIFYYFLVNVSSLIISPLFVKISKKYNNKILAITGMIFFILTQVLLNKITYSYFYLILIAICYAIYRRGYWISRRFYNLKIIEKKDISKSYSIVSIANQIGLIFSSYIGSYLLDFVSIKVLTLISIVLFFIGILCLYKLNFVHEKNNTPLEIIKTFKQIPKRNLYLFGSYELINVLNFFLSLYLFIYIKNNYQTIGILNIFSNIATILFAYLYGNKINGKKNYLKLSIIFTIIIYFLNVNTTSFLLIIISFLKGISTKMYEISISKEFYILSKKFEYQNYNLIYELTHNIFRAIPLLIGLLFTNDLKHLMYITLSIMFISLFLNFKYIKSKDYEV